MSEQTEIIIERRANGFCRVRFPQKPNDSAIRGFHGILTATGLKMKWDKTGDGDVYWTIPPGMAMRARRPCLEEAVDMIRYWYGESQKDGKNRNGGAICTVRVAEVQIPQRESASADVGDGDNMPPY